MSHEFAVPFDGDLAPKMGGWAPGEVGGHAGCATLARSLGLDWLFTAEMGAVGA